MAYNKMETMQCGFVFSITLDSPPALRFNSVQMYLLCLFPWHMHFQIELLFESVKGEESRVPIWHLKSLIIA